MRCLEICHEDLAVFHGETVTEVTKVSDCIFEATEGRIMSRAKILGGWTVRQSMVVGIDHWGKLGTLESG